MRMTRKEVFNGREGLLSEKLESAALTGRIRLAGTGFYEDLIGGGILLLLSLVPLAATSFWTEILGGFFIYAIFALSLDIAWGHSGILSFGHAAYFGLGAYTTALVLKHFHYPMVHFAALGVAVGLPAAVAMLLGVFLFYSRVTGVYFTIVTLMVTLIFELIAKTWYFVGSMNGIGGIPSFTVSIPGLPEYVLSGTAELFYLNLGVLVLCLIVLRKVVNSPLGKVLSAIKTNEERTQSFGYDTAFLKTVVFGLSAALAGLAGGLYATFANFVAPTLLGLMFSTEVIIWVAVGGRGALLGPVLGALTVNYLKFVVSDISETAWPIIMGIFFLLVVFFFPNGLVGSARKLFAGAFRRGDR